MTPESSISLLMAGIAECAACLCAWTDLRTGFIFDTVTIPFTSLILIVAASFGMFPRALAGFAIGAGSLLALYAFTKGKGLGLGDVKLAGCLGCGLGPHDAWLAIGAAFVSGGIYAAHQLMVQRAARTASVAFGPFLCLGGAIGALHGLR